MLHTKFHFYAVNYIQAKRQTDSHEHAFQDGQNRYWTIIINFFMGTILIKGSNLCFLPFAWKNTVSDTMVANKSYFFSYVRGSKFQHTLPNQVCTSSFINFNIGEEFQNLFCLP